MIQGSESKICITKPVNELLLGSTPLLPVILGGRSSCNRKKIKIILLFHNVVIIFVYIFFSKEKSISVKYKSHIEERSRRILELESQLSMNNEEQKKQLDLLDQEV